MSVSIKGCLPETIIEASKSVIMPSKLLVFILLLVLCSSQPD